MADFHGQLLLRAEARPEGRTSVGAQSFRAPFHLSKPYWDADTRTLLVQVVNPTAGILSGDRLESSVEVAAGAALTRDLPQSDIDRRQMRRGGALLTQQGRGKQSPEPWGMLQDLQLVPGIEKESRP